MNEKLDITQQMRQQQVLSPQLVQFGRYLEMSAQEIEDEVARQLDDNPALERRDEADYAGNANETASADDDFGESAEQLQRADYRDDEDMPEYQFRAGNASADDGEAFNPVTIAADDDESMYETLARQLDDYELSDDDRDLALYIIGNLDDNGYLTRSLAAIADDYCIASGRDTSKEQLRRAADTVRSLEPAGLGAVDLRDCLLLQLARRSNTLSSRIAREIISDYFDLFAKKHYSRLRAALRIDDDELQKALNVIRSLNPKPGNLLERASSADRMRHIVPDFSVEVDADGLITVALLSRTPELAIEASFADSEPPQLGASHRQREAYTFVRRKRDDASAFIKMMTQRADTLLAVMTAIARLQSAFFRTNDRSAIRPMVLRDIGAITGYDLSTISRATAGKYVQTSAGVFPLKMFFNEAPTADADTSSHEIMEALRDAINNEDKHHPLSDRVLTQMLADKGYDIARRTVAKYREKMNFPVARLRKE
ncbi:MAG: RNA polymerase factor sigma-54 [Muribaculaceae bacterium]